MAIEKMKLLFELIQLAVGTRDKLSWVPTNNEWEQSESLAEKHGLSAFVLDGVSRLPASDYVNLTKPVKVQMIGVSMHKEATYQEYLSALASLARVYNDHGIKMMVLKGFACSLNWPLPAHRPTGDIDVWLFGKQRAADEIMEREQGISVNHSHHHHTVFTWQGFTVENHYDFINVHHHRSHVALERELKRLGADDSHWVELHDERVYLPSVDLHALFLLRHGMLHFAFGEFTLRNLLDWGFFVRQHRDNVNWPWLMDKLDENGMTPLFHLFNAICVVDLGFEASLFPPAEIDVQLKKRVLSEIINPKENDKIPSYFLSRVVFKFRRWRANAWKHRLCYKESLWSAFWSGVWSHLLKPKSI